MGKRIAFIINPISGKKAKGPERRRLVENFLAKRGQKAEIWETEWAGHATELAQAAVEGGAERLVCVGGDGTINEIGRALVGSAIEFALVPMGSGNGLARHLGIPLAFEAALELAIGGASVRIDTGEADGRAFFNVMGLGFDAEVGRRFNESKARGFLSYLKEGWGAYRGYRPLCCSIDAEGTSRRIDAYVVAIANSSQYGSNAYIAPDASLIDGKLNLVAISEPSLSSMFVLLGRMFSKRLYGSPRVTPICSESFVLRLPESGFFHADGEIFSRGEELRVRARPQSLSIVAPAPSVAC